MFDAKKITRENFVDRLTARDERALDYVIDSYGGMIRSIVRKRLSSLPNQWEECENDILLAVWNEIGHFDSTKNNFTGWLAAVCRYKAIDCLRRSIKYRNELPLNYEELDCSAAPQPEFGSEVREAVLDLLRELPEEDRRLFWDCYVREKPADQLARERNIKVSALYNRLSRGRKKLKQIREVKP
ncbi:sigma-70 family RNA polymerase sigma factor [Caproicibacter sp.]|uniref:sigma-70 family RNA polymerase sigma factor n=1 Tax=Caproicibacter sp. TaxID=2814884 RepID=UPI003989BE5E